MFAIYQPVTASEAYAALQAEPSTERTGLAALCKSRSTRAQLRVELNKRIEAAVQRLQDQETKDLELTFNKSLRLERVFEPVCEDWDVYQKEITEEVQRFVKEKAKEFKYDQYDYDHIEQLVYHFLSDPKPLDTATPLPEVTIMPSNTDISMDNISRAVSSATNRAKSDEKRAEDGNSEFKKASQTATSTTTMKPSASRTVHQKRHSLSANEEPALVNTKTIIRKGTDHVVTSRLHHFGTRWFHELPLQWRWLSKLAGSDPVRLLCLAVFIFYILGIAILRVANPVCFSFFMLFCIFFSVSALTKMDRRLLKSCFFQFNFWMMAFWLCLFIIMGFWGSWNVKDNWFLLEFLIGAFLIQFFTMIGKDQCTTSCHPLLIRFLHFC
jgi:hypothetical protein